MLGVKNGTDSKTNNTPKTDKIASTVKTVGLGYKKTKFIKTIFFAIILAIFGVFLIWSGIPLYIGLAIVGISAFIVVIDAIEIKRLSSANIDANTVTANNTASYILDSDEEIIDHVSGILRTGSGAGSYSVLGQGKNYAPENALIITNKNIWAITVPLPGAGQIISGTDISHWQWMTEQNVIEDKLKEMLSAMTFDALLKSCGHCNRIPFDTITKFKIIEISHAVKFETSDKNKYTYSIRDNDDYNRVKMLLSELLSNKLEK